MPTRDEIFSAVAAHLATDESVAAGYVFGSVARGSACVGSDLDVGILFRQAKAPTFASQPYGLAADLGDHLGIPVDVVVMNGAPVDLTHRVLRDGELVYEADRSARIAFEVRARNEYFDLLPYARVPPASGAFMTDADLVAKKLAFIET